MEETLAVEEVSMKKPGAREHWQLLARNHQGAHHPVPQRPAPAASNVAVGPMMGQVDPDMVIKRGPPTRKAPEWPHGAEAWQPHQDSDNRGSQQSLTESQQQMHMVGKDEQHVTSFSGPVAGNVNTVHRDSRQHSFSDVVIALGSGYGLKDEDKRSPASRAYNRAFNKILGQKNPSSPGQQDTTSPTTRPRMRDNPLLVQFEQDRQDRKAKKEAKKEAKRLAEEAEKEAAFDKLELHELANNSPESALGGREPDHLLTKATKGRSVFKLFNKTGIHLRDHKEVGGVGDARHANFVKPKASLFGHSVGSSQGTIPPLKPTQTAKKDLHFATVESEQRDVQPWTMEEYMEKNSRITEWKKRGDDEEFGGIEGNQLMNNYFNADLGSEVDSDDDDS